MTDIVDDLGVPGVIRRTTPHIDPLWELAKVIQRDLAVAAQKTTHAQEWDKDDEDIKQETEAEKWQRQIEEALMPSDGQLDETNLNFYRSHPIATQVFGDSYRAVMIEFLVNSPQDYQAIVKIQNDTSDAAMARKTYRGMVPGKESYFLHVAEVITDAMIKYEWSELPCEMRALYMFGSTYAYTLSDEEIVRGFRRYRGQDNLARGGKRLLAVATTIPTFLCRKYIVGQNASREVAVGLTGLTVAGAAVAGWVTGSLLCDPYSRKLQLQSADFQQQGI